MTLTEWLREQLDADERVALAASRAPWTAVRDKWHETDDVPVMGAEGGHLCVSPDDGVRGGRSEADADHIAAWDPARVLAEVKAKRAILDGYEASYRQSDDYPGWEGAMYAIAQPYADREGWQPEWSVD